MRQALADTLLVQAKIDKQRLVDAIECSNRSGGGLVLTGDNTRDVAEDLLNRQGYARPVLLDRARYAGKNRKVAGEAFDDGWIAFQRRLPLAAVMPDTGYVGEGDEAGLINLLRRARDLAGKISEDVVVPLALHVSWLAANRGLPALIEHVRSAGVPVAVAMEHTGDPLSVRYALDGLVTLLSSSVPVIVLRCDVSALGALCYGALAAAVGTTSALRHLYPVGTGFANRPQPAAVVLGCLAYLSLNKIDQAVQADPDNQLWCCECPYCRGRALNWLGSAPRPETMAYLHSLETLYQVRNDILGPGAGPVQRRRSWYSQCDSALFQHVSICGTVFGWKAPKALENWRDLLRERGYASSGPVRSPSASRRS
ncbi:hypothetical protein [Goodfellowiella coeruleoviolacea]|uniref:hypothetical protein n=1 Tax=Goodfellowiella coeruleoviolacea TaxID=334858 RepID=UPI0020A557B5|nr:hypothetical protein [Goodfellowiella coeruleoviolacea]